MGRRSLRELVPPWAAQNWRQARDSCVPVLYRRAFHLRPEGARFSQPRATPSFMHTSRKPQCFNELQNRTNWSCSDRTFTISPIFRANGYLLKRPFKSRPRCVHQRGQRPGERWTLSLPNKNRPNGPTVLDRTWDRLARWADRRSKSSRSPGRCPRSCTQVGSLSVSMSCKIAQTGLAVTAPSPSRPSSARNGYLLKRPFKSRPRCVHQRGRCPGLGEPRAFGPVTHAVSRNKSEILPTRSQP